MWLEKRKIRKLDMLMTVRCRSNFKNRLWTFLENDYFLERHSKFKSISLKYDCSEKSLVTSYFLNY